MEKTGKCMIVKIGIKEGKGGGLLLLKLLDIHTKNQQTERREEKDCTHTVRAFFCCKATSIHRSSL